MTLIIINPLHSRVAHRSFDFPRGQFHGNCSPELISNKGNVCLNYFYVDFTSLFNYLVGLSMLLNVNNLGPRIGGEEK